MENIISKGFDDEIFVVREHSLLIDIARLIDSINKQKIMFDVVEMEINFLCSFVRSDCNDKEALSSMSNSRRDEPVIVTHFCDGNRVIDGNHRLIKRFSDGFDKCQVIEVPLNILEQFIESSGG